MLTPFIHGNVDSLNYTINESYLIWKLWNWIMNTLPEK